MVGATRGFSRTASTPSTGAPGSVAGIGAGSQAGPTLLEVIRSLNGSSSETIERGKTIFFPGDPAERVYLLRRGAVRLSRVYESGEEITVALLRVQLQDASRLVLAAEAREKDLRERVDLIERLRAAQRAPVALLEAVSLSLPDGLWLLELKQTGASVRIEGRAESLTALTDFVDRLQHSGRFVQALDIVTTNMEAIGDASVVRFAIRGDVRVGA